MIKLNKINIKEALRHMQYKDDSPDNHIMELVNKCERGLLTVIEPRYLFSVFNILNSEKNIILENCNLVLSGKNIREHLKNCEKAVLFCATISSGADKLIRSAQVYNMAEALVLDSLASVAIEQVCDEVEKIIRSAYPDMYSTWRFSPGYGDLPITTQSEFLNVLDAPKRIGLTTNSSFILTPSKSVTAIVGLSKTPIIRKNRNCEDCNIVETCASRKNGSHCN